MNLLLRPIAIVSNAVIAVLEFIGGIGLLLGDSLAQAPRALVHRRSRRLGWHNVWAQMVRVGVRSVPIVSLVLLCIGSILSLQMAPVLKDFGALDRVADIISVAVFRELGPLVSAVVLTGFAGASIAAELGTMVVSEEIEAMQAAAINPVRFLVLPRVVATTVMMICVAVTGDVMGIAGGWLVAVGLLGITTSQYFTHTFNTILEMQDFITGLTKAGVFGALISGMACYLGLRVTGGAQGVGVATTRTVVYTIVALITVDLLFTSTFYALGW